MHGENLKLLYLIDGRYAIGLSQSYILM